MNKIKAQISRIISWWNNLNDKAKHAIVCAVGSFCFGYGFGLGAGIAAEYKDQVWNHSWDWLDILADIVGTVVGSALRWLIFGRI